MPRKGITCDFSFSNLRGMNTLSKEKDCVEIDFVCLRKLINAKMELICSKRSKYFPFRVDNH